MKVKLLKKFRKYINEHLTLGAEYPFDNVCCKRVDDCFDNHHYKINVYVEISGVEGLNTKESIVDWKDRDMAEKRLMRTYFALETKLMQMCIDKYKKKHPYKWSKIVIYYPSRRK